MRTHRALALLATVSPLSALATEITGAPSSVPVAELAEVLAGSPHAGGADFTGILNVLAASWPEPRSTRQAEIIEMTEQARDLWP